MMALLNLPSNVWQYILYDWIALTNVIRFYCAVSVQAGSHLNSVYSGHEFALPSRCKLQKQQLIGLANWLHTKNAIVHSLEITHDLKMEQHLWERVLRLTSGRIRSLIINQSNDCSSLVQPAFMHCANLSVLNLKGFTVNTTFLRNLFINCSRTLRSLHLGRYHGDNCEFPEMLALKIIELGLCDASRWIGVSLLSKCPNLIALCFDGGFANLRDVAAAVATCCRKLQRLRISNFGHHMVEWLQLIVGTCTQIGYLEIYECRFGSSEALGNVLRGMPNLHTLSCPHTDGPISTALIPRAAPSLRALNISETSTTVATIRSLTAALPHLNTLYLSVPIDGLTVAMHSVLEHCPALQCLVQCGAVHDDPAVMAVLQSAVLHCPLLDTICIKDCLANVSDHFMTVISRFSNLRKLSLRNYPPQALATITAPLSNPGLIVTSVDVPFPEWMPST